ncbi:putative oxido [Cyphellophora attinorum]|uniref:Putative oxido n=1 Tax=Cyphellophora attinorum TaxID=1664694 RepID=A0A0N1P065_9EURO|nr:putative oxido [Phialophora attinorum]KPI38557.1 putative oxido [Phialophora attinorum]
MAQSTTPSDSLPLPSATTHAPQTWIIIGASRGIGLEFSRQLLARGDQVIAVVRDPMKAAQLWQVLGEAKTPGAGVIEQCDVTKEGDILAFATRLKTLLAKGVRIENVILNAGVLKYPNRATEISYADFAHHLYTNTIGPIICAQEILKTIASFSSPSVTPPPKKIIFISSDSGSATLFRDHEDGFGAYAASKAALNQMLRHMAAEIRRKEEAERAKGKEGVVGGADTKQDNDACCVLALHPGEVATDMADVELDWEVEGIIQPDESVREMLKVIEVQGATG